MKAQSVGESNNFAESYSYQKRFGNRKGGEKKSISMKVGHKKPLWKKKEMSITSSKYSKVFHIYGTHITQCYY